MVAKKIVSGSKIEDNIKLNGAVTMNKYLKQIKLSTSHLRIILCAAMQYIQGVPKKARR